MAVLMVAAFGGTAAAAGKLRWSRAPREAGRDRAIPHIDARHQRFRKADGEPYGKWSEATALQ